METKSNSPSPSILRYRAVVGCSYMNKPKARAGEMIPEDWPQKAIKALLERGAIEPVGG